MTPDEAPGKARDLLDGTTPGPWEVEYDREWAIGISAPEGIVFGPYYDQEEMDQWETGSDADLRLAAAAPVLAAMIAGMHEEWGVVYEYRRDGQPAHVCRWIDVDGSPLDHHAARRMADRKKRDGYDNVRIVRRYVTEPEEV